jgi:uncharacterized protein (DUF1015 family)
MATLRAFRAVRPAPELAARVASVPYDVVDTAEARKLAEGNDASFLHVIRPEIDLPPGTPEHGDEEYRQAAKALRELLARGVLVRDEEPALYLYRQTWGAHSQVGIFGCAGVDDYDCDRIKKHEKTRPDKEDDRTRHILTLSAHDEPVFLAYAGSAELETLVAAGTSGAPLYDFVAPDGVGHTVWRAPDPERLVAAMAKIPALYVADGHHRSAAASRARAARREQNPAHTGGEEYNFFLAVVFAAEELKILPYNRVVHDLAGQTAEAFVARLREVMAVREGGGPTPSGRGRFAMYLGGRWYEVDAPESALADPDPVASLDAAILQSLVLAPLLGIDDPRTSRRIDFVGGIRGSDELVRRVEARGSGVAFALHPVSMAQLIAVSDAGMVLPPKSTWFEPKLRSGLAVHEF